MSSSDEIEQRFSIPKALANYYARQAQFFCWLRYYRDQIVHSGKGFESIFITEKGFAVATDKAPFSSLSIWNDKNTQPNNLGSIRSIVSYSALNTISALEEYTYVIQRIISFPEDIAPNHKIFIRGPHVQKLIEANSYLDENAWV